MIPLEEREDRPLPPLTDDALAEFDPLIAGLLRRLPRKGEKRSRQAYDRRLKAAEINVGLVLDESSSV